MRLLCTFVLIFLICPVFAQEISLFLNYSSDSLYDSGVQIQTLEDDFIIMGSAACPDGGNLFLNNCLGLMRVDQKGKVQWRIVYNGGTDDVFYDFQVKSLVVHEDTVYTVGYLLDDNQIIGLRLAAFDKLGTFLFAKDHLISNEEVFINGMIHANHSLLVFGQRQLGDYQIFLRQFDLGFNLQQAAEPISSNKLIYKSDLIEKTSGGYLLIYEEAVAGSQVKAKIRRLNDQFEVTAIQEIPEGDLGDPGRAINVLEAGDGGYVVGWHKDLSYTLGDTFPFPSTIYKLDTSLKIEWEYVFVHNAAKDHLSLTQTESGHLFGAGSTDFSSINDIFPDRILDGWCFLLNEEGQLLWERIIADNSKAPPSGAFRYGIETETGFVMVGEIGLNPLDASLLDVWLLSIDQNGCRKGNCNEFIVINGENPTHSENHAVAGENIDVYPNPTNGELTIICESSYLLAERKAVILDAAGKKIMEFGLDAPKSTINLSRLNNGQYFIIHIIGERPGSGHHNFSAYLTAAPTAIWAQEGKVDHDISRVVSGISDTALDPRKAARETVGIFEGLMG